MTKPDTLTKGATAARQKWKDVLQGQTHKLKLGYYCVRLPDDDERSRKISRIESLELATRLFDTTPPWSEIEDRGRFGIPNLVSDLSEVLIRLVEEGYVIFLFLAGCLLILFSLPALQEKVNKLLSECQKNLDQIPPRMTVDPTTEILSRINAFCNDLSGAVSGDGIKPLAQQNRKLYANWKTQIFSAAPDFRPFVKKEQYVKPVWPNTDPIAAPAQGIEPLDLTQVQEIINE